VVKVFLRLAACNLISNWSLSGSICGTFINQIMLRIGLALNALIRCLCYRGPLCLLRVELGVLTNGRLGTVEMVSEYIKHEQAEEVNTMRQHFTWGQGCELNLVGLRKG